jgi:sulfur-carrier protein
MALFEQPKERVPPFCLLPLISGGFMKVHIPSPLLSYTNQHKEVDAAGATVAELLADLNRQYPGIRFRMVDEQDAVRQHMRIFVNGEQVDWLAVALKPTDEVYILQALSGG